MSTVLKVRDSVKSEADKQLDKKHKDRRRAIKSCKYF